MRVLERSLLAVGLLVAVSACETPTEHRGRQIPTIQAAIDYPPELEDLFHITLVPTTVVLITEDLDEPAGFGDFSCESGQRFSFQGTVVSDADGQSVGTVAGRGVLPAVQETGDLGPLSFEGGIDFDDGSSWAGIFLTAGIFMTAGMSEWSAGARSCSITDGIMSISITTAAGWAISKTGAQVSGGVPAYLSASFTIASDLTLISHAITVRHFAFTDPAEINLIPPPGPSPVGTAQAITALVGDFFNESGTRDPVAGVAVRFSVTGSTTAAGQCTTDALGQCAFTYTGPSSPGTDDVTAFADGNGDGVLSLGEPSASAIVVWGDDEPPAITVPPNVTALTAPGLCTATISSDAIGTATATDNVGVASLVGPAAGAYPLGTTAASWTATDAVGNTSTATQTITILDQEPPALVGPPNVVVGNDAGRADAAVLVTATATDNCGVVTLVAARSDGRGVSEPYPVGETTISWTATDGSGSIAAAASTVTVNDVEAPTLVVPGSVLVNATMPSGAVVSFTTTTRDNVSVAMFSCTRGSGTTFPIGVTTVTCTASDAAGNSASKSFAVTVIGAAGQIVALVEYVKGVTLPSAFRTTLLTLLQRVLSDPRSTPYACVALDAFIAGVRAKTGTMFTADVAARIIADATRIKSVLGCR